jgi:hypothetical protein
MLCALCNDVIQYTILSKYCYYCNNLRRVILIYGKDIIDDAISKITNSSLFKTINN